MPENVAMVLVQQYCLTPEPTELRSSRSTAAHL